MRIYVLTQEDAFYIPRMLDHLLESEHNTVGIGIVPGEMRRSHFGRYLRMLGVRDFAVTAARLAACRVLDMVGRRIPLQRSFSIRGSARRRGVSTEFVARVNDPAFVSSLRARRIDVLVSIACPQVMKKELLSAPQIGAINIHGALLPQYQGLLPSFWVLVNGESETGITVHWIDEQLDHGAILFQKRVPITPTDTVHTLVSRSKIDVGKHLLVEALRAIARGDAPRVPMDHSKSTYFTYPDKAALRQFRQLGRRFI